MGLFKTTTESVVTRQEFEALAAQLESFKAVAAIAFAAINVAANAGAGMPDAVPRKRLELLAAAADLEPGENAEFKSFTKRLDVLRRVESAREFREAQARALPRRGEDFKPPSWRG